MPTENVRGTSTSGNHDCTPLAHSSMVATAAENDNCNPTCVTEAPGPTFTVTLSPDTSLVKKETEYAGMSPVWQFVQDRRISKEAAELIMASWRDGTKKQYSTYITKWQNVCNQRQINPIQPSLGSVLDFLTALYQQGLTYSAINTARSARKTPISVEIDEGHFPRKTSTTKLVEHLKQSRPGVTNPLVKLKAFEDKTLCIVTTLQEFLTRTQTLRGTESQLFISYQKSFKKVNRDTISRWVKSVLTDSGIDTSRFKPHSTRAASTSAASNASVSLDDILQTAGWSSECTFAIFYNKPIAKENTFADGVLSTASNTTV
ncbi:hypothetical protein ACROYT_G007888 [Oculina patagonica]